MAGRLGLVALCLAPHLLRLLGGTHAPRDGSYAHAAWMMATGFEPYVQFMQPAFPFAEGLLAAAVRLFGHDVRVAEACTTLIILATARALFRAGRSLAGPRAGALAAIAFSWALWVLHFHLFERETWAALGIALALAAYLEPGSNRRGRLARVAAGLALACLVKLTAVMSAVALCAHLLLRGRGRDGLRLAGAFGGLMALATGLCWLEYGRPFLVQVFLFGFFREATHDVLGALRAVLAHAGPTTALGLTGCLLLGLRGLRRPLGAATLLLLADLAYLVLISPTLWDHNLIPLAVGAALLAGVLLDRMLGRRGEPAPWRLRGAALGLLALHAVAWLAWADAGPPDRYGPRGPGFGGQDRGTVLRRGWFLQRYSEPGQMVVCADPWWAFQAGRVSFARYWDTEPVLAGLEQSLAADGLAATWAKRSGQAVLGPGRPAAPRRVQRLGPYPARVLGNALTWLRPRLLEALGARRIALVMEPLVPGVLTAADLRAAGYEHFADWGIDAWRPAAGAAPARVEPISARY